MSQKKLTMALSMTCHETESPDKFRENCFMPKPIVYSGTVPEIIADITKDVVKLLETHDASRFVKEHPELQSLYEEWLAKKMGYESGVYLGPHKE